MFTMLGIQSALPYFLRIPQKGEPPTAFQKVLIGKSTFTKITTSIFILRGEGYVKRILNSKINTCELANSSVGVNRSEGAL